MSFYIWKLLGTYSVITLVFFELQCNYLGVYSVTVFCLHAYSFFCTVTFYDLHCNYLCTYNVIESFVYMLTLEFMGNLQCKVLGKTSYMGVYTSIFWFFTLWIFLGCFLMLIYLFCTCRKLLQFFVLARGEERWWMRELVFDCFCCVVPESGGGLFVQDEPGGMFIRPV